MIFTSIEVENYGAFRGRQVFDLRPQMSRDSGKSIILFGGKNGSGKTTLFEAFQLCLFGSSFQGRRLPKPTYHRYLRQRIHSSAENSPSTASISLEFEHAHAGQLNTYAVKRAWTCGEQGTSEVLEVRQNDALLRDLGEEQWQEFVFELVPPEISRLFFFNGEQIQDIAEDQYDNKYLIDTFRSLLGLDLVEQLQGDLRVYVLRKAKEESKQLEVELSEYEKKLRSFERQLNPLRLRQARTESRIRSVRTRIELQEHRISREGGGFASKREELKKQGEMLEERIRVVEEKTRSLCSGLFPFALAPRLCQTLTNRLLREDKYEQYKAAASGLDSILEAFAAEVRRQNFWKGLQIGADLRTAVAERVAQTFRNKIKPTEEETTQIIHQLSENERTKILEWVNEALNSTPVEMRKLVSELSKLSRDRQSIEQSLLRAPSNDVFDPLIQGLTKLHEQLGGLQEAYRTLEEEERGVEYEHGQITRQIEKKLAEIAKLRGLSTRVALAKKVEAVLLDYTKKLRSEKIRSLSDAFVKCFQTLSNKKHLIEEMRISSDDFAVHLQGRDGQSLQKSQLSAGEKQVYAIAMLWALAQTSGRPLPFVMDTPFGKLDAEHRQSIIRNFLRSANNQIIIFSTNTEIDQQSFAELQPYVSKTYHLQFDEKSATSSGYPGYFW